jgi:uncharacterized surface protein with fasciclin (FAS1) repeats
MRTLRSARVAAVVIAGGVLVAACGSSGTDASKPSSGSDKTTTTTMAAAETIVGVAAANPDFSTLVTAVKTAGLESTLSGPGPYTVFAPTNEAFAKIPKAQLDAILADQQQLTSVLTYHVLPSAVKAGDLQPTQSVATVQGANVDIKVDGTTATINGCNIVKTDIQASNGVIHVIDCVLIPPTQ